MKRSRVHTVHNGSDYGKSTSNTWPSSSSGMIPDDDNSSSLLSQVKHLKGLPKEEDALAMLNRIRKEFLEIVQRSKWNVWTVTEMCCCHGSKS